MRSEAPNPSGDAAARARGPVRYLYVGGGASGTTLLLQHVRALAAAARAGRLDLRARPVQICVVERSGVFGPGLPYGSDNLDCHLVNVPACEMSVDPDDPGDFLRWLGGPDDGAGGLTRFPPRTRFGRYLAERFADAERLAACCGVAVRRVAREAVALRDAGGRLRVAYDGGGEDEADVVVLATGHAHGRRLTQCADLDRALRAAGSGGLFDPWPAGALRRAVPPAAAVSVVGSSLTAVDAAFTLLDDGGRYVRRPGGALAFEPSPGCRRLTFHARTGMLPRVRSVRAAPAIENPFLTKASIPELIGGPRRTADYDAALELFRRRVELAHAAGGGRGPFDWEAARDPLAGAGDPSARAAAVLAADVLHAARGPAAWNCVHYAIRDAYSAFARLYPLLSPFDRKRFNTEFYRYFSAHAGPMPLRNGEKTLALLRAGVLRVAPGLSRLEPDPAGRQFLLWHGREVTATHFLVDAAGYDRRRIGQGSPLLASAIARGLATAYPEGGLAVDYDHSYAIRPDGRPSGRLFATGAPTLGQRIGSSAMTACAKFAQRLVEALMRPLLAGRDAGADPAVPPADAGGA